MLAYSLFAFLLTVGVVFYCILHYGRVTGEEFSPDNFTRRQFVYWEVPLLGIQVWPIDRTDDTNDLERFLTADKLITEIKTTDAQRRWDLVQVSHGGFDQSAVGFSEGEARILCSYLDAQDENKKIIWLEWSKQHQELAKILWPMVAKLARQELYVFVPDLLLAARGASDALKLQEKLEGLLADKYLEMAQVQQQLGRHAPAVELFTEVIALAPERAAAFTGRANSLAVLGEKDRATADLAQAQKIGARR
jgi:tetratricopeptide (TPR) repeat protein